MEIKFRYLPDGPPVFDTEKARARWAAARADYLAGGGAPEVCERHGLSLRTFRYRASKEGWRRADQPAPFTAPDTLEPAPAAQAVQNDPLVIPDAPTGAIRDATEAPAPPLTASEMVDKAWAMLQAAMAAGRLIEARGWLRLYKELKLHVPFAEMEARRGAPDTAQETPRETPPAPPASPDPEPEPPEPDPAADLARLATQLAVVARQVEQAACGPDIAPPLPCFSDPQCNPADDLARLVAGLKTLTGKAERTLTDEALARQLHCFSGSESNGGGPGP
jgi:hypothetical protein